MNLMYLEWKKIINNRYIIVFLTITYIMNMVFTVYSFHDKENGKRNYDGSSYKKIYSDIASMGNETAYAYIGRAVNNIQNSSAVGEKINLEYTNDLDVERMLLSEVRSNMYNCMHYNDYIKKTITDFNKAMQYGGSGKYSVRNMRKTIIDFENLININPEFGPSRGIELLCCNDVTDFMILILIIVMVVQIIIREYENGEMIIFRTTKKGYEKLICAKSFAIMFTVIILSLIFWGTNYVIGECIYGYGDLSRPIQSIDGFVNCIYKVNVRDFLCIFMCLKILIYFFYIAFIVCVALISYNSVMFYIVSVLCFGIEGLLYYGINTTSVLANWKHINIYSFLKTKAILGEYHNINIFNMPYSYLETFVFCFCLGVIIFFLINNWLYKKRRKIYDYPLKQKRLFQMYNGGNLFVDEAYKVFIDGGLFLLILIYGLFICVLDKPLDEEFHINNDSNYEAYIEYLKGPVCLKTELFIHNQSLKYRALINNEKADEQYINRIMPAYAAFTRVAEEATPYLKRVHGEYIHDTGYKLLTGDAIANNKDIKLGMAALIVLIVPLSYIYGMDYQRDTINIIRTSYLGRGFDNMLKVLVGILSIVIVYFMTYFPFYYKVINKYGLTSISAPACSLQNLSKVSHDVSIGDYLVLVAVIRFVGLVIVMFIIFLLSKIIKNVLKVSLTAVVLFVFPMIFAYVDVPGAKCFLLNPFLIGNICR